MEFIVKGPPSGVTGLFVTRSVDTGPGGENDPNRAIASNYGVGKRAGAPFEIGGLAQASASSGVTWLGDVAPVRTRRLYFSEKPLDPDNPNGATEFYITVDGQTPAAFDPKSGAAEYRREAGNGGRLDHREPFE